ncbi:MAG: PH domain-containing protein [Ruminococcus sp.]
MKQYQTDPHVKYLMQGLTFLICLAVCLLLIYFFGKSSRMVFWLFCLCLLAWILIGVIYIPLSLSRIRITVTDKKIILESGIFLIRTRVLLIRSLQLSSILQTPLSQYTGLNFIPLRAYGGSLILPFLSRKDAQELYAFLTVCLLSRSPRDDIPTEAPHVS